MAKFRVVYNEMIGNNKEKFLRFKILHDQYKADRKLESEFNKEGVEILKIIKDYESRLCNTSENSGFGVFSSKLTEKYWTLIRRDYPLIDLIGVKTRKA